MKERLGVETETHATDGDEMTRVRRVVLYLLAQALDVSVEGSGVREFKTPPECVETELAGHDLSEARREQRQEVELLATQFDLFAASSDGATHEVDAQVAERDDLVLGIGERSTKDGANARDQFAKSKGL